MQLGKVQSSDWHHRAMLYVITACQRSFGKVMFSQVSVCSQRGSHVTVTLDALVLAVQAPIQTSDPGHDYPCYWHLVASIGDLFKLVHLRTPRSNIWYWPLKNEWFASGRYAFYWNAFVVYEWIQFTASDCIYCKVLELREKCYSIENQNFLLTRSGSHRVHTVPNTWFQFESYQWLWVRGSKRLSYSADHQEVSRCHTRGESEKCISHRQQSRQVHPLWL